VTASDNDDLRMLHDERYRRDMPSAASAFPALVPSVIVVRRRRSRLGGRRL